MTVSGLTYAYKKRGFAEAKPLREAPTEELFRQNPRGLVAIVPEALR
jgi:hypothetical protein